MSWAGFWTSPVCLHSAIIRRCSCSLTIVNPQISKGDITSDILMIAIRSAVGILTPFSTLLVVGDDSKKLPGVEQIGMEIGKKNVIIRRLDVNTANMRVKEM